MPHPDVVKRLGVPSVILALTLVSCSTDYTEPQKGETDLTQEYAAIGSTYPLREPMFIACGYYRIIGMPDKIASTDVRAHMLQPDDPKAMSELLNWESIQCGQGSHLPS